MKNKTTKFISKMFILFPIGFGIWYLLYGFENFYWFLPTLFGLVFAFGIVFWNLFDYEKFNDITLTDFLESSHKLNIENSDENWNRIIDLIEKSIIQLKVLGKTQTNLKVKIPGKISDSILSVEKINNGIVITIEKEGLIKFLPDNAKNYKLFKKLGRN